MKKTITVATFVALGAGTAGVSAYSDIQISGSDTLNKLTQDIITLCPGATGLTYVSGGSSAGESALVNRTQQVSPMSRALANSAAVCGFNGGTLGSGTTEAENIRVAADGLSIVTAQSHRTACDPGAEPGSLDCDPLTIPSTGLKYTGVASWRSVLRNIYFGLEDADGTNPAQAARDCNNAARVALVNTWGNMFENNCAGAAGCTQLKHAFRRDENSGTTDVFRELNLVNGSSATGNNGFPFCNEHVPGVDPAPSCLVGTAAGLAIPPGGFENFQDNDPIKRTCTGTNNATLTNAPPATNVGHEQVCSVFGNLGLVQPVSVPQVPENLPPAELADRLLGRYPTAYCSRNSEFQNGQAPLIQSGIVTKYGLCPHGGMPKGATYNATTRTADGGTGTCLVPVAIGAALDRRCLNGAIRSGPYGSTHPLPPVAAGVCAPATPDGRSYNMHARVQNGNYLPHNYAFGGVFANRLAVGAAYRVHATRTLLNPSNCSGEICCQQDDATRNIGCLVQASPCSMGFAGREARDIPLNAAGGVQAAHAMSLAAIPPEDACVSPVAIYPLSRLLFINTLQGFRPTPADPPACSATNVREVCGDELGLGTCFSGNGLNTPPSPPFNCNVGESNLSCLVRASEFIPVTPACIDFNEQTACGAAANNNACANNPSGIAP